MNFPTDGVTVYVDAGYIRNRLRLTLPAAHELDVLVDSATVSAALTRVIEATLGLRVARQLWYDGVHIYKGMSEDQMRLSVADGVIFRPGQLVATGDGPRQKCVDTMLVRDMVVAVLEGDRRDIVLVSGDYDMVPAVEEAMRRGVRVFLAGFESPRRDPAFAQMLMHAAHQSRILDAADFAAALSLRAKPVGRHPSAPALSGEDDALDAEANATVTTVEGDAESTGNVLEATADANTDTTVAPATADSNADTPVAPDVDTDAAVVATPCPPPLPTNMPARSTPVAERYEWGRMTSIDLPVYNDRPSLQELGERYGIYWFNNAPRAAIAAAGELRYGSLPQTIDSRLLRAGSNTRCNGNDLPDEDRGVLRKAFAATIGRLVDEANLRG